MKSLLRFALPSVLGIALLCGASIAQASSPPAEREVHVCKVLDYEAMRARDSLYAARKQAFNLDVGAPRTVRMIYFLPNDRPFRQEVVDSMKTTIRQIQTFFRDQMRAHGHGALTFRFETDAQGDPLVHRVDGQHPDSRYIYDTLTAFDEVGMAFDIWNNVYLIVVDNSVDAIVLDGFVVAGVATGERNGGHTLVPGGFHWTVAAHELGHAFGLKHDFNNDAYIMSYGDRPSQLSTCHAEYLSMHPFFNAAIPDVATSLPTIELISSPFYSADAKSVSIRLRVGAPNGLHQVILGVYPRIFGTGELKACRELNGERDAVVQFDYDGVIPGDRNSNLLNPHTNRFYAVVVDIFGYIKVTESDFSCANCPITLTKIAGDNQQGRPGETLTNPLAVAVRDKNRVGLQGMPIKFSITSGEGELGGRFTTENATTDATGRARSKLTLGPNSGTNTIEATTTGLKVTFNARGIGTPTTPIPAINYQTAHLPDGALARLGKGNLSESDRAVAFSSDGQLFAVASGIGVWLYDATTARELALLTGHSNRSISVSFSPDSRTLASGSGDGTVKLWDVATRRTIATLTGHTDFVTSVAFSPDGTTIAVAGARDRTVVLWDVATRRTIATLTGHTDHVTSVAFSPDSRTLASGSWDRTVVLWNVATGRTIATLTGHTDHVTSVAFSPDSRTLASGSWDRTVKLWNVATRRTIATLTEQKNNVTSVAFSHNGTTLASGSWEEVKLWDVTTRQNIATLTGHTDFVTSIAFSPDETTLASGSRGEVKLWDTNTQNNVTRSHTSNVTSVLFSPDGATLASGSWDRTVKLWDVATRRTNATLTGHTSQVNSISFSRDGTTLASGSWDEIKLWNVATRRTIATLAGAGSSVSFSPDGRTLASGSWEEITLWDVATRQSITTLTGHTDHVNSVSFSPNGTTLASGSGDRTVRLWDVAERRTIATLTGHTNQVNSVSFSPDGTTLASGSWDEIKLWDVATRRTIATFEQVSSSVSFSPDGATLVSGSWAGIELWNVATRQSIATLIGHTSNVTFSPDGRTLASGADNGTVLLWDISPYATPSSSLTPDFNGDGRVNFPDFLLFAAKFGLRRGDASYDARFDLDGDGTIGFGDFLRFARAFGREGS